MIEKLDDKIKDGLMLFLIHSIGGKSYDGITYALLTSSTEEEKKKIASCNTIRKALEESGIEAAQVLQALKVPNGVIFDLNIGVMKELTFELAKEIGQASGGAIGGEIDLINDGPIRRREADIREMVKYLASRGNDGVSNVEIALFSRNSTRRIVYTAKDKQGRDVQVKMNAYAVRHWDIPTISNNLMELGYKITGAKAGEILPSKTGVRFTIQLAKI